MPPGRLARRAVGATAPAEGGKAALALRDVFAGLARRYRRYRDALATRGAAHRVAHAIELSIEGAAVEAENLRRQRLISPHGLEHAEDVAALDLLHRQELRRVVRLDADPCSLVVFDLLRQIVDAGLVELGEGDRALDAVLEL